MLKFLGGGGNRENQKKTGDKSKKQGEKEADDVGGRGIAGPAADHMDLPALPEGCIATIVSLTTPRDAGTMSLVSRSFRSAAGCDPVWDKFFPHGPFLLVTFHVRTAAACVFLLRFPNEEGATSHHAIIQFLSNRANWAYGFESHATEVTIGLIGEEPTKQKVFLDAHRGQTKAFQPGEINEAQYPKERNDGWLEIETGEFFCQEGEGGELEMVCWGHQGGHWKGGLIFQGIDIRPKMM